MNNALLFITSGIISLCIYSLVIIALIFVLFQASPTHYSALKDSHIALHAISIDAIIIDQPTPENQNKKPTPTATNNPLAGSGIKDMFKKIDNNALSQNTQIGDNRDKIEQNNKERKIRDLRSAAESLQNKINTLSNLTISTDSNQNDGEYDEWYAEIEKIMLQRWQKTFQLEDKLQALVNIRISENGTFSYKIVKYSGDAIFDNSLETMLKECTQTYFPPHPKGKREIATTFKN